MGRVVAFPGVILTARETDSESQRPGPTVVTTPCPVCPAPIRSDDMEVITCTTCGTEHHSPCFWRVLPIAEWAAYLAWIYEAPLDELEGRDYICAARRTAEA